MFFALWRGCIWSCASNAQLSNAQEWESADWYDAIVGCSFNCESFVVVSCYMWFLMTCMFRPINDTQSIEKIRFPKKPGSARPGHGRLKFEILALGRPTISPMLLPSEASLASSNEIKRKSWSSGHAGINVVFLIILLSNIRRERREFRIFKCRDDTTINRCVNSNRLYWLFLRIDCTNRAIASIQSHQSYRLH